MILEENLCCSQIFGTQIREQRGSYWIILVEGRLSKHHCEEKDSKRKYISFFGKVCRLLFQWVWIPSLSLIENPSNLRGKVPFGSQRGTQVSVNSLTICEVYQLYQVVLIDNNVFELDIKMCHLFILMHVIHNVYNLEEKGMAKGLITNCDMFSHVWE